MEKPFKTISEQLLILESRGLLTDGSSREILEREGYYSVVNDYKDPFLDSWKTAMSRDDRYRLFWGNTRWMHRAATRM